MDAVTLAAAQASAAKKFPALGRSATRTYGTATAYGLTDNLSGSNIAKATLPDHICVATGVVTSITVPLASAGTITFAIGGLNPLTGYWIPRKVIGTFTGVVGSNTFTISEPINAGEIVAMNNGTATITFTSSAATGSNFIQANTNAKIVRGGTGSAYAMAYTVVTSDVADLSPRASYHTFGSSLIGNSTDASPTPSNYKFDTTHLADAPGSVRLVKFTAPAAGTVQFAIGVYNRETGAFTARKTLPLWIAKVGPNTFHLDEYIGEKESLALAGGTTGVYYSSSGIPGNTLVQANGSGTTATIAAAYYSYQYFVGPPGPVQTIVLRAKLNGTVGTDCEFSGNRAIQDALELIQDASYNKRYRIDVYPGIYQAVQSSDFNAEGKTQTGTTMVSFIAGKSWVSLRGIDRDRCIIRGFLPNNLTSTVYQYHQTVYWHAHFGTLENLTITGQNLRYPIHIDGSQLGNLNFWEKLKNCSIEHVGNSGNATAWGSCHPIGLGTSDGLVIEYDDIKTKSTTKAVYSHTNQNFAKKSSNIYTNCSFQTTNPNQVVAEFQSLGSGRNDEVIFNNCALEGGYIILGNDTPWIPTSLAAQSYNHAETKIKGTLTTPFVYDPSFKGFALRVTSATAGTSSTVRFDTSSTAFAAIVKDKDYTSGTYTDQNGITSSSGYAYRDGVTDLAGYAIGRLDVGDEPFGLSSNVYGKSLGHRLGDCATTPKTLGIVIDGTTYTVTFNLNYLGSGSASAAAAYTNAQIVSAINAVLGSAGTASLYAVGNDYFPEINNFVQRVTAGATLIKQGMAVYNDGSALWRPAKSTDSRVSGIALDTILPGQGGRVLTRGYIRTDQTTYRFSTLQASYAAVAKGVALGIDSANDGMLSAAASMKLFTAVDSGVVAFNLV